jgi:activating signal cointegrator complex subunit 1
MPPKPPRLTHFLCLPLVTPTSRPQLSSAISSFRDKVTKTSTPELPDGIPEKAIRPLGTLHLTLGVMSLLSQERIDSALRLLRDLDLRELLSSSTPALKDATGPSNSATQNESKNKAGPGESGEAAQAMPLHVTLRGLASMHTPSKTSILYSSPVGEDLRLYKFCQKLRDIFTEVELMVEENRPLLLHATIVNTVYVPGGRGKGGHGKNRAKLTIDAREILEDYEDFEWMSNVRIEKVAICMMGAQKKEDGEEEYIVEGEVEMP